SQSLFMPRNVPGLSAGFTDDRAMRCGDMPEFRGKAALEKLFGTRGERKRDYRLRQEVRTLTSPIIAGANGKNRTTGAKLTG
ncbi:MAG: hypothetical protein J2P48_18760, partial [Alphaproteobacteria bacterium]|nr:hypothetical protein [Alphaproteobacteria bacterium]